MRIRSDGFTLLEAMLAVGMVALLAGMAALSVIGQIRRAHFEEDIGRFARTLRITGEHAILSGQTLAVVIRVYDGTYTVYPATAEDVYDADETEPLIDEQILDKNYIDDIEWEDGTKQYSGELILKATPQGWKRSVVLTLLDLDKQSSFLRCERLTPRVVVSHQELNIPETYTELSIDTPL